MDRLDAMATLVAAVEAGSLSGAARKLGTPLATVSRKVQALELHLGTQLVNRSSRRLTLTETGRAYLAAAKQILDDVAEAERTATGEYSAPRGDLVVSAPIVFGRLHVLPVALEFLLAYPDIDLRLVLSDRVANLIEDRIDLAVRIGELPDSNLVALRVGQVSRVVCAGPAYLARRGTPAEPRDLSSHDCITFEGLASPNSWTFGSGAAAHGVPIRSRLTVNTAEAAIDAAVAGVGLTRVLSYQVAKAVQAGALTLVLGDFEPPAAPVSLVHGGQPILPLKLRAFIDFAAPRLRRVVLSPGAA
jgi:DNA-binding transcriptional LysR family regulator